MEILLSEKNILSLPKPATILQEYRGHKCKALLVQTSKESHLNIKDAF